jgi:hypothetical protein
VVRGAGARHYRRRHGHSGVVGGTEGTAAAAFGVEVTARATVWGGGVRCCGGQRRDTEGTAPTCRKSARWRGWWWRAEFMVFSCCLLCFFSSSGVTRNGHLVLLLDRQCVGCTVTSSNRLLLIPYSYLLQNIPDSSLPLYDCQKIFMEWGRGKSTRWGERSKRGSCNKQQRSIKM